MAESISSIPSFLLGNITQMPDFKIRSGQILSGTVLEVNERQAVLLLQGINIVAELETALTPGERVTLQVEALTADGRILLKKLDGAENSSVQEMGEQELKAVLQHLGLPEGKLNQSLVAEMLRSRLPIAGPHLQEMAAFAAANDLSPGEVPALTWLWSQSLPLTPETVAAIHNLMENGPDSSFLQDLFEAFAALPAGETENTSLRHLFTDWANLPVSSSDTPATATVKIEALIAKLGLNYERTLLQPPETVEAHHPGETRHLKDAPTHLSKHTGPHIVEDTPVENTPKDFSPNMMGNTTKAAKDVLKDTLKDIGEMAADPAKENNIATSLKYTLLKLAQSPKGIPASALGITAQKMLGEITGLQLLNISGQQEATESSSIFLAAWASFPEEKLLPLFLKIKRYKQQHEKVENPLYQIFFLLNTRHLGQIICRLALEKERLSCGFTVRGKEEKKLMDDYLGFLGQRLAGLPWQIVMHPTKINSTAEIKRAWQEEFFASRPGRPKALDARA